ncbi:MAG: NapC/NirT family cytochrome c [Gemmatimonadaceae bacterium]
MLRFALSLVAANLQQPLSVDRPAPGDTMTVFSPPKDITAFERVVRWFFSVPQWIEVTGAAIAGIIALIALIVLWRQRHAFSEWIRTRRLTTPLAWKIGLGVVMATVLVMMATASASFFVFTQKDNQFCLSCHTLHDEVYERFQQSKHHTIAGLRCHDCHDEPLLIETRQIALWVLYRPLAVGPHAPVPRAVCANCHIKQNPDSTWQRIIATAGHSIHLLSDTAKTLKIECLTCHGVTAHRFVPVKETCEQSGCHTKAAIKLGKMADQSMQHCTVCHQFTAPIKETSNIAVARLAMVPDASSCLKCHAMTEAIKRFAPDNDPHKGRCGDCHNPHTQTTERQAVETCTNAGCHARPDTLTSFHRGLHVKTLANCLLCHEAHTWKVKGTNCIDCHRNINKDVPLRRSSHED